MEISEHKTIKQEKAEKKGRKRRQNVWICSCVAVYTVLDAPPDSYEMKIDR